ncbi:MAG: sugar transferase [Clostridia bacterium]|nr:sugar transferase [Clostridia bacterium]
MYRRFAKRILDFLIALCALTVLSPILLILTVTGAVAMGGNPFFTQLRPGRIDRKTGEEKIFRMIKFRTMSNKKDENGKLLPDMKRLTKYGRFLRSSSLDELPELINILKGDMSIVGPRPLLVKYLPLYSERQRHRHDVRPGLTGLAQAHGRNNNTWDEIFLMDLSYVENITFCTDLRIIFDTVLAVLRKKDIDSGETEEYTRREFTGSESVTDENTLFSDQRS